MWGVTTFQNRYTLDWSAFLVDDPGETPTATIPYMPDFSLPDVRCVDSLEELELRLTRALGAVVGGGALTRTLGYRTQGAFRQALARERVPVPGFVIDGRRGRFALTSDIARWLWPQLASRHIAKEVRKK